MNAATTTAIGDLTLSRVVELEGPAFDPGFILPSHEPEVLEANLDWLSPLHYDRASKRLVMAFQAFVVRTPRATILVDTCIGNDKPRPLREAWHMRDGPFLSDLAALGVAPEAVDFVMCTHLHTDHVGWNTRLVDGRWVPTFANAKYIFARTEYRFWEQSFAADPSVGHGAFGDSVLPVMEAGQAVLVDQDHEIETGIWLEPAPGHTPGNVVINIRSGGDHAVMTGDVMHHPLQLARPDYSSRFCEDPAQSHVTRRALIERYADTDTRIAPCHFASPTIGRIVSKGDEFRFAM